MSEQKDKLLKQREKAIDFLYYAVLVSASIAILIYVFHFGGRSLSDDPEDWAVFGDFIGGTLNPIFAFFSFVLLLLTLSMQRKQLDKTEEQLELNREELRLTREELKKAADAQIDSARVMGEQLKTQSLQQFDSLFSTLLIQFSNQLSKLGADEILNVKSEIFSEYRSSQDNQAQILKNRNISQLFILLYQILKNIETVLKDEEIKKRYSNIVRSLVGIDILQLLLINCCCDTTRNDFSSYRELLEKFEFFEHLQIYDFEKFCLENTYMLSCKPMILLTSCYKYNPQAFGGNVQFYDFKESIFYEIFKSKNYRFDEKQNNDLLLRFLFDLINQNSLSVREDSKGINNISLDVLDTDHSLKNLKYVKDEVVSKSNVLSIYLSYPDYISIKIDARQLRDFLSS